MIFSCLCLCNFCCAAKANDYSKAEAVVEIGSGRVLCEFNSTEKLPMASTTKIITAITVIDNFDLNEVVKIPKECVGVEGSSIYLREGEEYTAKDLLYGLMLRSGNDAAEALAVHFCGDIDAFVKKMNETAKKYGAMNTNLTNPHGLHDENHYSTAKDLALISANAMKNEIFKEIVSTKTHVAKELSSNTQRTWTNKNKMLFRYDGAEGVKTGYTVKAGRCLVSCAKRDGMEVVSVVLNSPQMFERSAALLNYAFDNFNLIKIIDSSRFNVVVFDKDKSKAYLTTKPSDFVYPVAKHEKISCVSDVKSFYDSELSLNQKVGEIKIYCSKQLIFSQNIYTLKERM